MEGTAYAVALGTMLVARRRRRELGRGAGVDGDVVADGGGRRWGRLIGAKVLAWVEGPGGGA